MLFIGDLQAKFKQPRHVLNYVLAVHGPEPRGRVGIFRYWHECDLPAVEAALAKTAARRRNKPVTAQGVTDA